MRGHQLLRIIFQFIFLPIRLLYFFYLSLRTFLLRKKTILHWEFPSYFETANQSFLVRKIRGKNTSVTRLDFLLTLRSLRKLRQLKNLKIFLPPLDWTLGDAWEVMEELKFLQNECEVVVDGFAKEGSLGTLILLSACNNVYLNADSEFQLTLPSAEPTFYGDFLKHWGVQVESYASGPFKSFAESFTRSSFSKEARNNLSELVLDLQNKILNVITLDGKLDKKAFYFPILTSSMLVQSGFAKSELSKDDFFVSPEKCLNEGDIHTLNTKRVFRFFSRRSPIISVIPLTGAISSGEYSNTERELGKIEAYPTIELIKELGEDKKIGAIILEINSPGGSAFHSELLYKEIKKVRETKPVFAYFKDTAASGGYYIGSAAETITASPVCITGSIGAVMIRANLKKLYNKAKIQKESIGFYPYRDIMSEYTPLSKPSIQYLTSEIKRVESQFYERVKSGRNMTDADLKILGGGKVYLPKIETKVVDRLGGVLDIIDQLKENFPKKQFSYHYELPEFSLRASIPFLNRFTQASIPTWVKSIFAMHEADLFGKILYFCPIRIK